MNVLDRLDGSVQFSEEEAMLIQSVGQLARERIAPRAEHYDANSEFPSENIRDLNELGLNGMYIPEAYGGAGIPTARISSAFVASAWRALRPESSGQRPSTPSNR